MILDGYTQHVSFDSRRFSYRPALHWERVEFMRGHKTEATIREFTKRHVVWEEQDHWISKEIEALFLICFGTIPPEHGGDWEPNWELRDARNLREGVILNLRHPQVARRDCNHCKKWWYDDDTGKVVQRGGKPLLRPLGTVTACQTREGCPKGTPEDQKGLSAKNQQAWKHFQECDAVGQFPDDPIVRHNALIIRKAMKEAKRGR
jgi:hypothetical protein